MEEQKGDTRNGGNETTHAETVKKHEGKKRYT